MPDKKGLTNLVHFIFQAVRFIRIVVTFQHYELHSVRFYFQVGIRDLRYWNRGSDLMFRDSESCLFYHLQRPAYIDYEFDLTESRDKAKI